MFSRGSAVYLLSSVLIYACFHIALQRIYLAMRICMCFHVALRCIYQALSWFICVFTWLCVVIACLHSIFMHFQDALHNIFACSHQIFHLSSMILRSLCTYFYVVLKRICRAPKLAGWLAGWLAGCWLLASCIWRLAEVSLRWSERVFVWICGGVAWLPIALKHFQQCWPPSSP